MMRPGLTVVLMAPRFAIAHARRVYNVPTSEGLGWIPPRVIVTDGASSHSAYPDIRTFKARLSAAGLRVLLWPYRSGGPMRYGTIVAKAKP